MIPRECTSIFRNRNRSDILRLHRISHQRSATPLSRRRSFTMRAALPLMKRLNFVLMLWWKMFLKFLVKEEDNEKSLHKSLHTFQKFKWFTVGRYPGEGRFPVVPAKKLEPLGFINSGGLIFWRGLASPISPIFLLEIGGRTRQ